MVRVARGDVWLNHEQRGARAIGRHGERAVGHRELGAGQEAGDGQPIGPRRLLVGDDEIDPLEVKRPGAKVEHHGPVRGGRCRSCKARNRSRGRLAPGLGQELITARSLDQDRREIEIGPRGEPERAALAAEPIEHGDELLGAADHVFIVECRTPLTIRSRRIAGLSRGRLAMSAERCLVGRRRDGSARPWRDARRGWLRQSPRPSSAAASASDSSG